MPITTNPTEDNNQRVPETPVENVQEDSDNIIETGNYDSDANSARLNGTVTITDKDTPIVVLFGPPSCGKTMTLLRTSRYLRENGYRIAPDRNFRPSYDEAYQRDCDRFNQSVSDPIAASPTSQYMFVKIMNNTGKSLCQILEAPGEYYFDPTALEKKYPHYFNEIKNSRNRKVWCVFIEPNWIDESTRATYTNRITELLTKRSGDKIIIVYNKIDKTNFLMGPGRVNMQGALRDVNDCYPGLFNAFKNKIPIINWFKPYDCMFIPFQTGDFSRGTDEFGNEITLYSAADDSFPYNLWRLIKQSI